MQATTREASRERISTTIHGLDVVLCGGMLRGSSSLVIGPPGAGKTVLGNQIAFGHVAAGGRAVYVAHHGETHDRMITHLRDMSFFDAKVVGRELVYVSGVGPLETEGPSGLHQMLAAEIHRHHATLLVVDELLSAGLFAGSQVTFKRFVQNVQANAAMLGCTTLFLTTAAAGPEDAIGPAYTVVDGLWHLHFQRHGLRVVRELEVVKLRGGGHLQGRHFYEIGRAGAVVYPRIESVAGAAPPATTRIERVGTGIPELDRMTRGGWLRSSTTLVLGAAGSGKTLAGMHFLLAGAARGERGVFVGFYEPPSSLSAVAGAAGLDLEAQVEKKMIEIAWHPRREQLIDKVAADLLDIVARTGAKRLFIDSLGGFAHAAVHPGRMSDFFAAMANELRARGVTTIWSEETHEPQGHDIHLGVENVSAISDNIVLLRCIDTPRGLHRVVSVRKVRGSDFDSSVHELWVTNEGLRIAPTADSAIALLEGRGPLRTNVPGYATEPHDATRGGAMT